MYKSSNKLGSGISSLSKLGQLTNLKELYIDLR